MFLCFSNAVDAKLILPFYLFIFCMKSSLIDQLVMNNTFLFGFLHTPPQPSRAHGLNLLAYKWFMISVFCLVLYRKTFRTHC